MAKRLKMTNADMKSVVVGYPCSYCKHLITTGTQRNPDFPMEELRGWTCKAFPEEIPAEILMRIDSHTEQDWGQVGNYTYKSKIYRCWSAGPAKMSWDGDWVEAE